MPKPIAFAFVVAALLAPCVPAHISAQPTIQQDSTLAVFIDLLSSDKSVRKAAYAWLQENGTVAHAPALLDVLYFQKNRIPNDWFRVMKHLTGRQFSMQWPRWMQWLGKQNFTPVPAYAQFKALLYRSIDPAFAVFLKPSAPSTIRRDEIVWGGVKKDGIPALTLPVLVPAEQADYLDDENLVFGLSLNGAARAWPMKILSWHEMVNDTVGGEAVSLAYCTLCGAAVAYKTTTGGQIFTFGSSGLLYRSNKLMYDHQTNTLWSSLTGRPVFGQLVRENITLERLPVVTSTWGEWRKRHPDTLVLSVATGFDRPYKGDHGAYRAYFLSGRTMFPVPWQDTRLSAKNRIFGMIIDGVQKAWPLKWLRGKRLLNDRIGSRPVLLLTGPHGHSVRAYERGGVHFSEIISNSEIIDSEGNIWLVREETLQRKSGSQSLARLPGHIAFWFGWYAFFPETQLWEK